MFPVNLQRRVQLWSYRVSHSVLLLRANQGPRLDTRIDLMFRAVRQVKVSHRYENLSISVLVSDEAMGMFGLDPGEIESRTVYGLASNGLLASFVVAGSLHLAEDNLGDGDPSALDDKSLAAHIIRSGSHMR